jgi:hypothetical protein
MKRLIAALLATLLAACASPPIEAGRDFGVAEIARLERGRTRLEDAKAIFGPPATSAPGPGGRWTYGWSHARIAGAQARTKGIFLLFDKNDVLLGLTGVSGIDLPPAVRRRLSAF